MKYDIYKVKLLLLRLVVQKCHWNLHIINTVHLVGEIKWVHWSKKCTEWTTLKQPTKPNQPNQKKNQPNQTQTQNQTKPNPKPNPTQPQPQTKPNPTKPKPKPQPQPRPDLTASDRVLLDKLVVFQLVRNSMYFTKPGGSLLKLRISHHLALHWTRQIHSLLFHSIYLISILILLHLCLELPSGLFPSDFITKILYTFFFSSFSPHTSHPNWFAHPE